MQNQKIQNAFFLIVLLVSFILLVFLLKPYIGIIVASGALAIVFLPLHRQILKWVKGKKTIASLISILVVIVIILAPLFLIGFQVYKEASNLYLGISSNNFSQFNNFIAGVEKIAQKFSPGFSLNLNAKEILTPILSFTMKHLGGLFSGAAKLLLSLSLGLIALFYFLREGKEIKKYLVELSPLNDKDDQQIFIALKNTVSATIKGSLLIAVIQGFLTGVGFIIFNIPNATLWGSITVIASLIPGVGTVIIIGPAIIYLLATSHFLSAVGLLVWGIVAIGLLEHYLSPKLMKKGAQVHSLLILFSVLGGISLFGAMGILIGPIIVSLFAALIRIYPELNL